MNRDPTKTRCEKREAKTTGLLGAAALDEAAAVLADIEGSHILWTLLHAAIRNHAWRSRLPNRIRK
jgi:hypothetical protein